MAPTTPPLRGCRVIVTRAAHQAESWMNTFATAGAEPFLLPLIRVDAAEDLEPLERAAATITTFDWLTLTSANAVEAFAPLAEGAEWPPTAVVGPATAAALRRHGVEPALEASSPQATGLVSELAEKIHPGIRVLVPQAEDARPQLVDGLRGLGAEVTVVVAYRKVLPAASREIATRLFADSPLGWVTFTSPRIVRHFIEILGPSWPDRRDELHALSIGRITSGELHRQGVETIVEASRPSADAMVRAMHEHLESTAPDW